MQKEIAALPRISPARSKQQKSEGNGEATPQGRRVLFLRLSEEGRRFIAYASPRHRKLVKAEMRAIEGREQQTVSRILRKLRQGDPIRFLREIRMMDADEKPWGVVEEGG